MKVPVETEAKDTPSFLKGKVRIPLVPFDEPIPQEALQPRWLRLVRDMAGSAIIWPRRLGRPRGELTKAFAVRAYGLAREVDAVGGQEWALRVFAPVVLSEGPHDDAQWCVTISTSWAEPSGWANRFDAAEDARLKRDPRSRTNVIEVDLLTEWEAVAGLRPPFVMPAAITYVHPRTAPLTLPRFHVMRLSG
ncbi:hypothetical protein ACI6QG_04325 [Roseococcus sp. DSY-14]|uniref:hypothetical protein n=1 Tax=Roseococcus sp. DSY-14 TaxID=3369650 RepID=UPI00387B936C